jgi:CDP-diacylglycerol pyrophosphatase
MHWEKVKLGLAAAIVIGLGALASVGRAADPDALWKIVHDRCALDQRAHNDPAPCTEVEQTRGWAVLKDNVGKTQFLLIPTDRVTGIEDPAILAQDAPNYWAAAWEARHFVQQRAPGPLPDDDIMLAINSKWARSQNQLHIHVDCLRRDVKDMLRQMQAKIGPTWMRASIMEQEYQVRWVSMDDLRGHNLFQDVAEQLAPNEKMDRETIVLTEAVSPDGRQGVDVLAGRYQVGGNKGSGELLQDHDCAVAKPAP